MVKAQQARRGALAKSSSWPRAWLRTSKESGAASRHEGGSAKNVHAQQLPLTHHPSFRAPLYLLRGLPLCLFTLARTLGATHALRGSYSASARFGDSHRHHSSLRHITLLACFCASRPSFTPISRIKLFCCAQQQHSERAHRSPSPADIAIGVCGLRSAATWRLVLRRQRARFSLCDGSENSLRSRSSMEKVIGG